MAKEQARNFMKIIRLFMAITILLNLSGLQTQATGKFTPQIIQKATTTALIIALRFPYTTSNATPTKLQAPEKTNLFNSYDEFKAEIIATTGAIGITATYLFVSPKNTQANYFAITCNNDQTDYFSTAPDTTLTTADTTKIIEKLKKKWQRPRPLHFLYKKLIINPIKQKLIKSIENKQPKNDILLTETQKEFAISIKDSLEKCSHESNNVHNTLEDLNAENIRTLWLLESN